MFVALDTIDMIQYIGNHDVWTDVVIVMCLVGEVLCVPVEPLHFCK